MSLTEFRLDFDEFQKIFNCRNIRLRAGVTPQDVFDIISRQGYCSEAIDGLEPLVPDYYRPTLIQLLGQLNDKQEAKARWFVDKEWKALKCFQILKSEDLQRLACSIQKGDLQIVQKMMERNGITQVFPSESIALLRLFANIAENMFAKTITAVISTSLKQYAKSIANQSIRNPPLVIKDADELRKVCGMMRVLLKRDLYEQLFEAVQKIGMYSSSVVSYVKKTTFPACEQDLCLLLSRVPFLNPKIKILNVVMSVYLFLESVYFLKEDTAWNLIKNYFENGDGFQQLSANIGLNEHPKDYKDIDTFLNSLVGGILRSPTREIMLAEIQQSNNLVHSLFVVRQYIKGVKQMKVKEDLVQMIFSDPSAHKDLPPEHDQIWAAKKLLEQAVVLLPANIQREYKTAVNLFILGNFGNQGVVEINAIFQKEKNPSIYIVNIQDNQSERSLSYDSLILCQDQELMGSGPSQNRRNARMMQFSRIGQINLLNRSKSQASAIQEEPISFLVIVFPIGHPEAVVLRNEETQLEYPFSRKKSGTLFFYAIREMTQAEASKTKVIAFDKERQTVYTGGWVKTSNRAGFWINNQRLELLQPKSRPCLQILLMPHKAMFTVLKGQQEVEYSRQLQWIYLLAETTRNEARDLDICSLAGSIGTKDSPLSSVIFISFLYFLAGQEAYRIIIKLSLLERLYFLQAATTFIRNSHPDSASLILLYSRLHLKKVLTKPLPSQKRQVQALLFDLFQHYPCIINPGKMYQLVKMFPQEITSLKQLVTHHIIVQPEFDIYHYIETRLIQLRNPLQEQDPQTKYNFFRFFIEDLTLLASKHCRRTQSEKDQVLRHLQHQIDNILVNRNFFLSRQMCLTSLMIAKLYRQSKALAKKQREIGELLVGKLWIHLNLRVEDQHLNDLILALLARPHFPEEKTKLVNFFRCHPVPLPTLQQLIALELQDRDQGQSEIEEEGYLILEYISNNPYIEKFLGQLLLYLEQRYVHLPDEHRKQAQLRQKLKRAIEKAGNLIARARDARRGELIADFKGVCQKMQESWVRSMLEQYIQRSELIQQEKQVAKSITYSVLVGKVGSWFSSLMNNTKAQNDCVNQ